MFLSTVLLQAERDAGYEMGEYYKGGARAQVVQKVENNFLSCIKIRS